ncbi:MAG: AEC family transporter [Emergencia sp.]
MIAAAVCKLLLSMAAGWWLGWKKIFDEEVCRRLSWFVVNITMPLLIMGSLSELQTESRRNLVFFILTGAGFYVVLPLLAKLFNFITKVPPEKQPVYEMFYLFSNSVFMGYPVGAALYGSGCIFHLNMFNLGADLLYYTYGLVCASGGKKENRGSLKNMLNPGVLSCVLVLALFFLQVQIPEQVTEIFSYLGGVSSPLAMVILGANLGNSSMKKLTAGEKHLWPMSVIRLAVMPAAAYGVMTLLGFSGMLRGIAVISMGTPVAVMVTMGCSQYGIYTRLGSAGTALTTLISLFTIPVLILFLN